MRTYNFDARERRSAIRLTLMGGDGGQGSCAAALRESSTATLCLRRGGGSRRRCWEPGAGCRPPAFRSGAVAHQWPRRRLGQGRATLPAPCLGGGARRQRGHTVPRRGGPRRTARRRGRSRRRGPRRRRDGELTARRRRRGRWARRDGGGGATTDG
jgi:hypothetical protein